VESATAALGVLWVAGGALVFLVMAGLLLALAVWGRREPPFALTPENGVDDTGATPERYQVQPTAAAPPAPAADLADGDWPDALP
jgi:hypothetical protein